LIGLPMKASKPAGGDLAAIGRRYRRRERDDRDARGFRIAANLLEGLDAVDARQLDVHQHQVGTCCLASLTLPRR